MKKTLLSLAAASTAFAVPVSASAADRNHNDRNGRYEQRYDNHGKSYQSNRYDNQRYKHFQKGQRFDNRYARNYRTIDNPRAYGLRDAPRGQHWVQSGDDALLVGLVGGVIGAVIANAF